MKRQLLPKNNRGTILMLVVVSAFIMSIVGLGSINLMGLQEIQARAEADVVRANRMADAGIEMGKVWISTACTAEEFKRFPENVKENFNPIHLGRFVLGEKGYFEVSIIPLAENLKPGFIVSTDSFRSIKGSYIISSTGTVSSGGMTAMQHKSVQVYLERTIKHKILKPMPGKRGSQTCTLLFDGSVLIAGGDNGNVVRDDSCALGEHTLNTAILYSQAPEGYTPVGNMNCEREKHTATALTTTALAGNVLIVGGARYNSADDTLHSDGLLRRAEIYDPITRTFALTGTMQAPTGRSCHCATILPDGRVLITGGVPNNDHSNPLDTAELFNPATQTFDWTKDSFGSQTRMSVTRHCFPTVLLPDGRVFISGGGTSDDDITDQCDVYDPVTNTFTSVGTMRSKRADHAAILLKNGKVLIAGGFDGNHKSTNLTEIYDPEHNSFDWTRDAANHQTKMHIARNDLFFFDFMDGKVLIVGGAHTGGSDYEACATAEVYDPDTGTFTLVPDLFTGRRAENNCAVRMRNGDISIFGGWNGNLAQISVAEAEQYTREIESKKVSNSYIEGPVIRVAE